MELDFMESAASASSLHILIVDDHTLLADTLEIFLGRLGTKVHVSKAASVLQALAIAKGADDLSLALVDLHMPDMDGLAALRHLKADKPDLPVVIMSGDSDPTVVREALDLGAHGFLAKTIGGPGIIGAIRRILAGEKYVSPTLLAEGAGENGRANSGRDKAMRALSPRERQVLVQLTQGQSNKEIARELGIEVVTVTLHLSSIYRKLGVKGRTQAVRRALELHLS